MCAPLTGLCGEAADGTQGFVPVQLGLYGVTASGFEFHNCSWCIWVQGKLEESDNPKERVRANKWEGPYL